MSGYCDDCGNTLCVCPPVNRRDDSGFVCRAEVCGNLNHVRPGSDEVRSVSATGGEKGTKLARFDLLPVGPLREVAEHYGKGASKYADHNWRRGYEWSKSYAALQRHATQFWGGEDVDEETGSHHMAAVAFHALALLEFAERFPDFDDRFRAPLQYGPEMKTVTIRNHDVCDDRCPPTRADD